MLIMRRCRMSPMVSDAGSEGRAAGARTPRQPRRRAALAAPAPRSSAGLACRLRRLLGRARPARAARQACGALAERYVAPDPAARATSAVARRRVARPAGWPTALACRCRRCAPRPRPCCTTSRRWCADAEAAAPRDGLRTAPATAGDVAGDRPRRRDPRSATCAARCARSTWPPARLLGESAAVCRRGAPHAWARAAAARRRGARRHAPASCRERCCPGPAPLAERHAAFRRAARGAGRPRRGGVRRGRGLVPHGRARRALPLPAGEALTTRARRRAGVGGVLAAARAPRLRRCGWRAAAAPTPRTCCSSPRTRARPATTRSTCWPSAELVDARGWTERALHPAFGPHRLLRRRRGRSRRGAAAARRRARARLRARCCCRRRASRRRCASSLVRVERLAAALDLEVAHIAADYLDSSLGTEAVDHAAARRGAGARSAGHAGVHREAALEGAGLSRSGRSSCVQALDARPTGARTLGAPRPRIGTTLGLGGARLGE